MENISNTKTTLGKTAISALGYLLVASTCQICGFYFRSENKFILLNQTLLLIPLFAFFLAWVLIYDNRTLRDKQGGIVFGLLVTIYLSSIVISFLIINNKYQSIPNDTSYLFCATLIPFTILFFYLIFHAYTGRPTLTFRTFIFSPALVACVIPFIYGFLRSGESKYMWWASIFLSIFIILLVSIKIYKWTTVIFLIIFFFLSTISFFFYDKFLFFGYTLNADDLEKIRAFVVATDMALIMGLAESWWFIKDELNLEFTAENKDMKFYSKGVEIATSSLPFIIPFLILHKSFNSFTIILMLLALYWYYFYETHFLSSNRITNWKRWRIYFGLSIPVAFIISTLRIDLFKPILLYKLNSLNFIVFSLVGFSMGVLAILRNSTESEEITKLFKPKKLITITFCMLLFFVCWGFEFYSKPQRKPLSTVGYQLIDEKTLMDSIENSSTSSIEQSFAVFKVDSSKKYLVKESSLILGLEEKNNEELMKRAGIAKLIYAFIFVSLILTKPILNVYKKYSQD